MRAALQQYLGRAITAYAGLLLLALVAGTAIEQRQIEGQVRRNAEDFAISFEPLLARALVNGDRVELERLGMAIVAGYLIEAVEIVGTTGSQRVVAGKISPADTGPWALFMPRLEPQQHAVRAFGSEVATLVLYADHAVLHQTIKRNIIRQFVYATLLSIILLVILLLSLRTRELAQARDEARASLQEIARLEQTALQLTGSIPVGTYVFSTNAEGPPRFTFVSDRWLKMLDVERDAVMADPNNAWVRAHPDDYAQFVALNREVLRDITPFHWVGRVVVRGEVRWLEVESVPRALTTGGHAWEGVMIDITANKHAEQELIRLHERLTALEVEKTRVQERSRLLQDVHDGFGSQLTTARLQAGQGQMDSARMGEILDECMADLHLVVDTLGQQDISFPDAMTDFRFRTQRRLFDAPVVVHWELALDGMPGIPPDETLQLLRIVQEALNNALRHARASEIWIMASWHAARGLCVAVKDNGVGLPQQMTPGRGIHNMLGRARELGAELHIARRETRGTVVKLLRPTERRAA